MDESTNVFSMNECALWSPGHENILHNGHNHTETLLSACTEELEADTGSSLTELRNVCFSYSDPQGGWSVNVGEAQHEVRASSVQQVSLLPSAPSNGVYSHSHLTSPHSVEHFSYSDPQGGWSVNEGEAQREVRASSVQQVSLLPSAPSNGVYSHSHLTSPHSVEHSQSQPTPSSAGTCPPSVPTCTTPFPVLLCSVDGSFMQVLYSQTFNSSLYPLNWVAGSTEGKLNDHIHSQSTDHVQLSDQVWVPSVQQGQCEGLSHTVGSIPVQPVAYQTNKDTQTIPRTKKGKSSAACALQRVSVQLCSGKVSQGTSIKFCPAGARSKSEHIKITNAVGKINTQHQSSKSKPSRKVLVNRVNITGQFDFVEKKGQSKSVKDKPKKTAADKVSLSGKLKKKKKRKVSKSTLCKMSSKPSNYYPHWPTLELDEEEDLSSMAAFFKSIRSRRRDKRRFTSRELVRERAKEVVEKLCAGCEEGLKVVGMAGKGRGVVADRLFEKDEFVVEYAGELINITTANQREELYERDERVGCYMYYFSHKDQQYCIDATEETGKLGRLLNHSRHGNCYTKVVEVVGVPRLVLLAAHRIEQGQELTYDYGDRSASAVENHPWLKN